MKKDPTLQARDVFIAVFALVFAAMGAGEANAYGPDTGKAIKAATSIFKIIDTPSEINPVQAPVASIEIRPQDFRGEIEFIDVWFRYPLRPTTWVLKGLNLKIHAKESAAIIGESG